MRNLYDVIIIGAGVTGAVIARELSKYKLNVVVLEKETDVAFGATLANSAIVHSGHDPFSGTLKAKHNILGNRLYREMSKDLDIPLLECGGMVIATNKEEENKLLELYDRAIKNGLNELEVKLLNKEIVKELEPNITDSIQSALYLPTTAVTIPWEVAIANIENAMDNGVDLNLDTEVLDIVANDNFIIKTTRGNFKGKIIVNAAGLYADKIYQMISDSHFKIKPRRGEYLVLDNDVNLVNHVIYPVPTYKGKGVIATPQVHGNTLLGPTSEFVKVIDMERTSKRGIDYVKENISNSLKNIPFDKVIRTFAGSRPTSEKKDFIIEEGIKNFINVAGIDSPGLTAAPSIAKDVVKLISKRIRLMNNDKWNPIRKKVIRLNELSLEQKQELYKTNPKYANIICRCENISEAEVIDSINRNCGAKSVVGVKMRVRPGSGRCQGGFCQGSVLNILANELDKNPLEIIYKKSNSNILKQICKI